MVEMYKSGIVLILGLCLIPSTWSRTPFTNQCTLQDGKCVCHVEMIQRCVSNPQHGPRFRRDTDSIGNTIENKVDDVEKEHPKRIEDLEDKIENLVREKLEKLQGNVIKENIKELKEENVNQIDKNSEFNVPNNPKMRETQLLHSLHKEFKKIRHDLGHTRKRLRFTSDMLHGTRVKLNETRKDFGEKLNDTNKVLNDTTKELVNTKKRLKESKRENEHLKQVIEDLNKELNVSYDKYRVVSNFTCNLTIFKFCLTDSFENSREGKVL